MGSEVEINQNQGLAKCPFMCWAKLCLLHVQCVLCVGLESMELSGLPALTRFEGKHCSKTVDCDSLSNVFPEWEI